MGFVVRWLKYKQLSRKGHNHKASGDSKILHFVGSLVMKTPTFFIRLFEKRDVLCYGVWHPSVRRYTFSFLPNSSYSLHPIKLKLGI